MPIDDGFEDDVPGPPLKRKKGERTDDEVVSRSGPEKRHSPGTNRECPLFKHMYDADAYRFRDSVLIFKLSSKTISSIPRTQSKYAGRLGPTGRDVERHLYTILRLC